MGAFLANLLPDQTQKDKSNLFEELEMRNRLYPESRARICQETEELRRTSCEETERGRQLRIDEFATRE